MRFPLPLLLILALSPRAFAFDEFSDQRHPARFTIGNDWPRLTIKGELELELHDLEGPGGPGHDSPTDTKTIGTRSPFVEIDSFWLAFRLGLAPAVGLYSFVDFRPDGARVGAVFVNFQAHGPGWLAHRVEAGYHTPLAAIDRRTERYPLLATALWREPELHLAYEAGLELGRAGNLLAAASLAMMRPLTLAGVAESESVKGTINIISAGRARPYSGNGPAVAGRLRYDLHGAFLEGYGLMGRLAAEGGTDLLRSALPNYRYLPGAKGTGRSGDYAWAGGRLGYHGHGMHLWAEGAAGREDRLVRYGGYAQGSYELELPGVAGWFRSVEPLVRVETLRIDGADQVQDSGVALRSPAAANAASWDYDILTLALMGRLYEEFVRLRVEYAFVRERNGVAALAIAPAPLANDELLVQLEVRF